MLSTSLILCSNHVDERAWMTSQGHPRSNSLEGFKFSRQLFCSYSYNSLGTEHNLCLYLISYSGASKECALTTVGPRSMAGGANGRTLLHAREHAVVGYNTGQDHAQIHRE